MDKISCFNSIYSDKFSLEFDNLFSTIDFESFGSKENETQTEINNTSNTTSTASERPALTETTKSFMHFVIGVIGNRTSCRIIQG